MRPRHIFWIMTDEQRADSVGMERRGVRVMPKLGAIAAEGVEFAQAVTPAPVCIPARTSLLSGLLPADSGVWRNRLETDGRRPEPSLTDWLRGVGYRTVSLGKQHYHLTRPAFSEEEDYVLSRHVDYTEYLNGKHHREYGGVRFKGPTGWILAGTFPGPIDETAEWQLVDRAIDLAKGHDHSTPLFMRLSFNAPHTPVSPPAAYLDRVPADLPAPQSFLRTDPDWPRWLRLLQGTYANARLLTDEELRSMRRHYYAQCAFVDDMVGRFLSFLRTAGLYEDSVFVFCADHGAHLGDHGLVQKQSFFSESVTVPYVIRAPGVAPRRIEQPVSLMTLLPTVGGLAGAVCPPAFSPLDMSASLRRLGDETESDIVPPGPVISQCRLTPALLECDDRIVMVQDGRYRGVFDVDAPNDRELIYDLHADPHELESIDATTEGRMALDRLRVVARASIGT